MPFGYISGFLWFCSEQRLALYYVRHPWGANVVPDWGNFRDIFGPSLPEREIHTYIFRYKSVLMGDSGPSGWDWAGGRLKIGVESGALDFGQVPIKFNRDFANQHDYQSGRDSRYHFGDI